MNIDRKLNLVIELPRNDEPSVFVHSTGMAAELIEQYFYIAGPTMNALVTRGFGLFAPRYAASVLREVSLEQARLAAGGDEKTQDAFEKRAKAKVAGFFAESHRLTNVICMTQNGWDHMPLLDARKEGTIDDEEFSQIENGVVFFAFGLRSYLKEQRDAVAGGLSLCNARIESLSCMEFANSLKISMKEGATGTNQDASPVSSTGQPVPASINASAGSTSRGPALPHIEIGSRQAPREA